MCSCPRVVDITGSSKGTYMSLCTQLLQELIFLHLMIYSLIPFVDHGKVDSPREAIANQLATVLDISRRKQKVFNKYLFISGIILRCCPLILLGHRRGCASIG